MHFTILLCHKKANINRFKRCADEWGFSCDILPLEDLAELPNLSTDALLLHGGWYGIDRIPGNNQFPVETTPELTARGNIVRDYVKNGGGLVGVCAGSFNVVWLNLIPGIITRMAGKGPHELEVVNPGHPITDGVFEAAVNHSERDFKSMPVIRIGGPMLAPENPSAMLVSYDWEHRLGAILADSYGAGRAVAVSPHPERTENDLDMGDTVLDEPLLPCAELLRRSLLWAAGKEI